MTAPAAPARGRDGALLLGLLALAACAHGAQVADLGLYWDDILHFLQGDHASRGDRLRFVLSDTSGALTSERPLWFVILALARAAYALGVPALHAFLIVLLALEAFLVARVARLLSADPRVAWTAGALFLTLPLAPLQPAWGATVHYQGALLLMLVAILAAERALSGGGRWLASFLPMAAAYSASLLTQELFFLLLPAWLAGRAAWPARAAVDPATGVRAARGRALRGLLVLGGVAALYGFWRGVLLPLYGAENYPTPTQFEAPAVARRGIAALRYFFWPWHEVAEQLAETELTARPVIGAVLSALLFGVAFVIASRGCPPNPAAGERDDASRAVGLTALLTVAAVASRAAVPIDANKILGISSRFGFVALPAMALLFASLLAALLAAPFLRSRIARSLAALLLGATVAAGALAHGLVKEELVADWRRLRAVLDGVRAQAPDLAAGTFAVVSGPAFRLVESHEEMSSLFIALYDDPSLLANDLRRLRVQRGKLVSVTFGLRAHAFRPGEYGVFVVDATERLGDLDPDRLVLFRNHGSAVAAVPSFATSRGRERLVLRHNPGLVLETPAPASRAWRHLDSTR